jgi:hypothetical protein
MEMSALEHAPQRLAGAKQVLLPNVIIDDSRTHAISKRPSIEFG